MMKTIARMSLMVAVALLLCAPVANAELVLSLDGRDPGSTPSTTWQDLSGVNQAFTANGAVAYKTAEQAYEFGAGPSYVGWFEGATADESNFDFDKNNPFTVVVYGKYDESGDVPPTISKGVWDSAPHWAVTPGEWVQGATSSIGRGYAMGEEDYIGTTSGTAVPAGMSLFVLHFPGTGAAGNYLHYETYLSGSGVNVAEAVLDWDMAGSALNDQALMIGSPDGVKDAWVPFLQFVEVWTGTTVNGMTPADYSQWRQANLDVIMVPEPATLAVLGCGLALALLRKRR